MDAQLTNLLYFLLCKALILFSGLMVIYMGYHMLKIETDKKINHEESQNKLHLKLFNKFDIRAVLYGSGLMLCLFGAIIIGIQVFVGQPSKDITFSITTPNGYKQEIRSITRKGKLIDTTVNIPLAQRNPTVEKSLSLSEMILKADEYSYKNDKALALITYKAVIDSIIPVFNNLANLYIDYNKLDTARWLAKIANYWSPQNEDYKNALNMIDNRQ